MADINIGALSEAINDKMDRDMNNQNTGIHHIISTYVSGTSGYRIWDDGYCEQWGYRVRTSGATITFIKTFTNTQYNIYIQQANLISSTTVVWQYYTVNSLTTTGFSLGGAGSNDFDTYWKASGYLLEGEY